MGNCPIIGRWRRLDTSSNVIVISPNDMKGIGVPMPPLNKCAHQSLVSYLMAHVA